MKYLELKDSLKSKVFASYQIIGNDDFLISETIKTFKNSLVKCFDEFNFIKIDCSDKTENDYKNMFSTLPLGDSYRVVLIENINSAGIKQVNIFNKASFENVVIIIVKPTEKIDCETINCDHLEYSDIKEWLTKYFSDNIVKVDVKTLDYIINISNNDLTFLNSELTKVIGYVEKGEAVTIDIVQMLFTKNESYFVYNLTSAIDSKDKKIAFSILNSLQNNISISDIFTFMGNYFRKMFYLSINPRDSNLMTTIFKTKPYAIQKAGECVAKNGRNFYIDLYNKYVNLDYEIKSGKISPINAIYSLIL